METPWMRGWTWLIGVPAARPDRPTPLVARLFGVVTALIGVLFFAVLPIYGSTVGFSPLWFVASGFRSALVVGLGTWIAWCRPACGATPLEQHQGRIIATIAFTLVLGIAAFMWVDPTFYQTPLNTAGYLTTVLINAQILWLARVGMVRISSRILLLNV